MVKKQKIAKAVAELLEHHGVKSVFGIVGGASLHLLHALRDRDTIDVVFCHHESACAAAADGNARASGSFGVAVATSGPGATNLLTGVCTSFYDSIPVLFLTGQVSTYRQVGDTECRQIGFQETPVEDIFKTVTKYCVSVNDPTLVVYEIEKALSIMLSGRPGPVIVDIPDDIQREEVSVSVMKRFTSGAEPLPMLPASLDRRAVARLNSARRPLIILGAAANRPCIKNEVIKFIEKLGFPVALTWGAADVIPAEHKLNIGRFGTHGSRHTNFAVQNADLIFSLGSRLDTKATGTPVSSFAPAAYKIVVDVDPKELGKFQKFGLHIDKMVCCPLDKFLQENKNIVVSSDLDDWFRKIGSWHYNFKSIEDRFRAQNNSSASYSLIETLSELLPPDANIVSDTGCVLAWLMQEYKFKLGQRFFHDFNNTAMGWSLPASVGVALADKNKPVFCFVGDGSAMMSLSELATLTNHKLNVTVFLVNNSGYSMIKQTQEQWFASDYAGSCVTGGLSFPDFSTVAASFGLSHKFIDCRSTSNGAFHEQIAQCINNFQFIELIIDPDARVIPQVKAGSPNSQMEPSLPDTIYEQQMIVTNLLRDAE